MTSKKQTKKHHRRPARATTELVTRLQALNTVDGLSFREIAALDAFRGIPAGTLSSIVATGMVPGVWRERLCPYQPPARIAIRKDDMPSAARALIANLDPERLAELTDLLIHHAVVQVERLTEEFGWLGPWEEDEEDRAHACPTCGHEVIPVRPGKWQCDYCETMANFATDNAEKKEIFAMKKTFKIGDKVRASDNYRDEQCGEYAPSGVQVITETMDVSLVGTSGQWVKTDVESDWIDSFWFELATEVAP